MIEETFKHLSNDGVEFLVSGDLEVYRVDSMYSKEPETIHWLNRYLNSGYTFLDVGANIGVFSCYFSAKSPNGRSIAFEPEARNFRALAKNLSLNSNASWALPFAVGRVSEEANLGVPDDRVGNSGAQITAMASSNVAPYTIPVISVDDFLTLYPARSPLILKIDIDGREADVVKGAQRTLASGQIESVLIEFDSPLPQKKVEEIILPMGFAPDDAINNLPDHSTKRRAEKGSKIRNWVYTHVE